MIVQLAGRACEVATPTPDMAAFWLSVSDGRWEEDTFRFIDAVSRQIGGALTFVDIGASIGVISLYASATADKVIAIEPEPGALVQLNQNVTANAGNIEIWEAAVDSVPGTLEVFPTNGSPRLPTHKGVVARAVTFAHIDKAIAANSRVAVKVDIEGHEYQVLDALLAFCARRQAPLHLSLHPRSFSSRLDAFRETRRAVNEMAKLGTVNISSGGQATAWYTFRLVFLKRRPKNFAVIMWPA